MKRRKRRKKCGTRLTVCDCLWLSTVTVRHLFIKGIASESTSCLPSISTLSDAAPRNFPTSQPALLVSPGPPLTLLLSLHYHVPSLVHLPLCSPSLYSFCLSPVCLSFLNKTPLPVTSRCLRSSFAWFWNPHVEYTLFRMLPSHQQCGKELLACAVMSPFRYVPKDIPAWSQR